MTWYLGTIFFEKYFMVFDNSPFWRSSIEKIGTINYNYVGIARCDSHDIHWDISEDEEGRGTTASFMIVLVIVILLLIIGTVASCYIKHKRENQ